MKSKDIGNIITHMCFFHKGNFYEDYCLFKKVVHRQFPSSLCYPKAPIWEHNKQKISNQVFRLDDAYLARKFTGSYIDKFYLSCPDSKVWELME